MRLLWRTTWLACVLAMLCGGLARAETAAPTAADRAAAEALFNQARELMEASNFAPACEKLRASKELDPAIGTMLYLGDCYEKAQRLASAWMAFDEARLVALERKDERHEIAAIRAAALKPRLVYVVVEPAGELPEGLEVRANGRVLDASRLREPAPIDAGPLLVVASAPGYERQELQLDALSGAKEPYRAILQPFRSLSEPAPAAAEPVAPIRDEAPAAVGDDGMSQRTVAYIVGGVGIVALAAGGVFAILASGNNDDSLAACSDADPNACSVRGKSLRDDAIGQAQIATIAGIAGGVALAAGVTLYVTAPTSSDTGFGLRLGGTF